MKVDHIPNSVDTLAPNNRFVLAINTLPPVQGVPYDSIMGDRGKGGNKDNSKPVSSDGVVPIGAATWMAPKANSSFPPATTPNRTPRRSPRCAASFESMPAADETSTPR
ncbi:MAG TPA: hypothetical protein VIS96_06160 [Terrimicrobiaceae bacterium]